ncbi:MAG: OadG family protein [Opitutales bacterium]|nr:OadG family protein [Opitutales bacterium]
MFTLAALLPLKPTILQTCNYMLLGFCVVCIILYLLSTVTNILGFFFKRFIKDNPQKLETAAQANTNAVGGKLAAVVAAAVYVATNGAKCEIRSITPSDKSSK